MFFDKYLGPNDDWMERLRKKLYPILHPYLERYGGYALGIVRENQYVGTVELDEDTLEWKLAEHGFVRNPIAAYKTHTDGRESEGSWVLYHAEAPQIVAEGMQLHITLFASGGSGIDLYAHYEDDWRASAFSHLRAKNFSAEKGVEKATRVLDFIESE